MGQRHARNLRKICVKRGLSCSIDLLRTCSADVPEGIRGVYTARINFLERMMLSLLLILQQRIMRHWSI